MMLHHPQRLAVLRLLGYTNEDDAIALKGRVAAEINTTEELVLTELVFEGVLGKLTAAEAVAVLSALVFQGKCDDEPSLPPSLVDAKARTIQIATNLGRYQRECGLAVDPHDYASNVLNFGLMEVWGVAGPACSALFRASHRAVL